MKFHTATTIHLLPALLAILLSPFAAFAQKGETETEGRAERQSAQPETESTDLVSGPPTGTEITAVMAYAPVGPHAGEEYDAVAAIGDGPGALLFIHELTRNAIPVIRAIDQASKEFSLLGLHTATLILSDDRTAMETKLKAVNGSLKLESPVVLSLDGADGPGNYALNRKAVLTLIVLNEGKVVRSAAFTDVNQKDSATVREWITETTGPLPKDPKKLRSLAENSLPENDDELRRLATDQTVELHRLRREIATLKQRLSEAAYAGRGQERGMVAGRGRGDDSRMARGGGNPGENSKPGSDTPTESDSSSAKREGGPPSDSALNAMLRSFIRQTNDTATNDATFGEIKARANESDDLHSQTVEMFKLMLSFRDRYGTEHAQELAESFLEGTSISREDKKE